MRIFYALLLMTVIVGSEVLVHFTPLHSEIMVLCDIGDESSEGEKKEVSKEDKKEKEKVLRDLIFLATVQDLEQHNINFSYIKHYTAPHSEIHSPPPDLISRIS